MKAATDFFRLPWTVRYSFGIIALATIFLAVSGTDRQAKSQAVPSQNGAYLGVVGTLPAVTQELAYCQLSISSTATALSACSGGVPANARYVLIQPETAAIRMRGDGTAPSASVGFPLAIGVALTYAAAPLSNLQIIAQTGTSTVDVWFFR